MKMIFTLKIKSLIPLKSKLCYMKKKYYNWKCESIAQSLLTSSKLLGIEAVTN